MLSAAKTDALGAESTRLDCIARDVGIGAHTQFAERFGPGHELHQFRIVGLRGHGAELAFDHASSGAVERNPVSAFEHLSLYPHLAGFFVNFNVAGSGHATLAHASRNDRRVTGHATA